MVKRKSGLTYDQHIEFSSFINEYETATQPVHKMIIEAFGWSSPLGKKSEGVVLDYAKYASVEKLRFHMENNLYEIDHYSYLDYKNPYFDERNPHFPTGSIDTQGKKLPHRLTKEQHEEIGPILREWRRRTTSMIVLLKNSYTLKNPAIKVLAKLESHFDHIRNKLDDDFCYDYPREFGDYSPWWPYYGDQTKKGSVKLVLDR